MANTENAIARFAATADTDTILEAIRRDGAVIIEGLVSRECCDTVYDELKPYIESSGRGADAFGGFNTTRTGALVARSPSARKLVAHPKILSLCDGFLLDQHCNGYQLHLTQIIRILPGQGAQPLHRDRLAWGPYLKADVEPQLNTIWAMNDFTEANGATQVVPKSPHWDWQRKPKDSEVLQAAMPAGSVLVYTGSALHSGGENRSDGPRLGVNITYCANWLRQEENQYLACPPEIARTLDPQVQALLGYAMGGCGLGYYSAPYPADGMSDILSPEMALGRRPEREPSVSTEEMGSEFVPTEEQG